MKKLVLASVLGLLLVVAIGPTAFAHSHVETGNGGCVVLPDSYHDEETRGKSGFGIGVAKGGQVGPFGLPDMPGGLDGFPTQSANSAIEGGGCP